MSRCEDYPCCGHEAGGCPDPDGRYRCARCGGRLPRRATSAVCARCHADWRRSWARGEDDLADREDGNLTLRDAPADVREVLGSKLHEDDQRHALVAWCHRYTRDHKPEWANRLRPDGVAYRVQFASDADWLAHTWFRVGRAGRLDMVVKECRSEPTWPDGAPEYPKQALALREGPAAAPAGTGRGRKPVAVRGMLLCPEDQGAALMLPEAPRGQAEQEAWLAGTWFVVGRYGRWTGDVATAAPAAPAAAPLGGWRVVKDGGGSGE
jgi:hypothetical protein